MSARDHGRGPETYGGNLADIYDDWYSGPLQDPASAADFLHARAGGGRFAAHVSVWRRPGPVGPQTGAGVES